MKKFLLISVCLCVLVGLFASCHADPSAETNPQQESTQSLTTPETEPQSTQSQPDSPVLSGTLETDKLEIAPDYNRIYETSCGSFGEVESGFYYLSAMGTLYYADRNDPANWVVVCTRPDCDHDPLRVGTPCDATADAAMVSGDRIYKVRGIDADGLFKLLSTALDGTDQQTAYMFAEADEMMAQGGGSGGIVITPEYLACYISVQNPEGKYDFRIYTADQDGVATLIEEEREQMSVLMNLYDSGGGLWFRGTAITDDFSRTVVFTPRDGELVSVDLTGLRLGGSYFSQAGDKVWNFRPNDGYYLVDTATREEVKLAEPQIENGDADIALPNCIIESTLFYGCREYEFETHQMRLFDGQQWREVTLPEEVQNLGEDQYFHQNIAVASDRVFMSLLTEDQRTVQLYQILLRADTLTLEYVGTIG